MKPRADEALAAIRAKCMDCSGGLKTLVERCPITDCPLYPFRSLKAMGMQSVKGCKIKGQMSFFEIIKKEA